MPSLPPWLVLSSYRHFLEASGYFGHYLVLDVPEVLEAAAGDLPTEFDGEYYVYQGELDVTEQIELGGKGQYINGANATMVYDDPDSPRSTFEDIDGLEVMDTPNGLWVIFQEDSGNKYGERMFISKLELDGNPLTYYLIAIAGGELNTRTAARVGIPRTSAGAPYANEFSGVSDLSGWMYKNEDGDFTVSADDDGYVRHDYERLVDINDKHVVINLQSHNLNSGINFAMQTDRGGQIYMYQPNIPGFAAVDIQK